MRLDSFLRMNKIFVLWTPGKCIPFFLSLNNISMTTTTDFTFMGFHVFIPCYYFVFFFSCLFLLFLLFFSPYFYRIFIYFRCFFVVILFSFVVFIRCSVFAHVFANVSHNLKKIPAIVKKIKLKWLHLHRACNMHGYSNEPEIVYLYLFFEVQ